jgi:hypothetical protein
MIRTIFFSVTILTMTFPGNSLAQAMPGNDLWLASINDDVAGEPVKISTGTGYNNQPHFSNDGSIIYYTRELSDDGAAVQTDIAAFHTGTSITTMVNHTPESEYSPTPIPGRRALSVIQVEADQKQRLWAIDVTTGKMDLLLAGVEPVGYHAWISDDEVAMFILGESFTLQTAKLGSNEVKLIADNIGRSIRRHPLTGEVLFVDKHHEPWQIAAFDPATTTVRSIMPLFPGNEDFTIDAEGIYWTGNGSKLYQRSEGDRRWKLVADFSRSGLSNISRLAIHLESNQIALVSDHTDP